MILDHKDNKHHTNVYKGSQNINPMWLWDENFGFFTTKDNERKSEWHYQT
jgi:hypothetical protein